MIVKINKDNTATIIKSVKKEDEDTFLQINANSSAKYKKVDKMPTSFYGFYLYDPQKDTFVVDEKKELEKFKKERLQQIKEVFVEFKTKTGRMYSKVLNGVLVDAVENVVLNMSLLCDAYPDSDDVIIPYRVYNNTFVNITGKQLHLLKKELRDFGLAIYKYKWDLEEKINKSDNISEVKRLYFNDTYVVDNLSPFKKEEAEVGVKKNNKNTK